MLNRWYNIVVLIAFFASSIAAVVAISEPATSYELSIFSGTPVVFWILVAPSLFVSVTVAIIRDRQQSSNHLALAAGAYNIGLITILPTLRGYYFLGEGDMMTHLGYTNVCFRAVLYDLSDHNISDQSERTLIHQYCYVEIDPADFAIGSTYDN